MRIPTLLAVIATALLTLSACGSGSSSSTAQQAAATIGAGGTSGLGVASTSLGKVLVDTRGMTVYLLSADGRDHSTCSAQCLRFWPAVGSGGGSVPGVKAGHTQTPDGTPIATVAGHPVYTFALDHQPGDVKGEGVHEFGGTWYAVSPTGSAVRAGGASTSPSSGASSPSTGRAYDY